jgi:hypothetical protein
MNLIVLATTGLLACAFYIYVLCQWMRDAKGKRTPVPRIDGLGEGAQENKRPYIVGTRKIGERHGASDGSLQRAPRMAGLYGSREGGWTECERIAYQKIASSVSLRKRS